MLRSSTDREQAYGEFERVRENFKAVLDGWALASHNMKVESSKKLQDNYQLLEQQALAAALKAIETIENSITNARTGQKVWFQLLFVGGPLV